MTYTDTRTHKKTHRHHSLSHTHTHTHTHTQVSFLLVKGRPARLRRCPSDQRDTTSAQPFYSHTYTSMCTHIYAHYTHTHMQMHKGTQAYTHIYTYTHTHTTGTYGPAPGRAGGRAEVHTEVGGGAGRQ
jgi:hypothetical protein